MRYLGYLIVLLSFFMVSPARAETITIVADSWCPYNCDPSGERPGFMIEIAKKAFEKHGISVEYKIMPWARAIEETRKGKYSAIVGASLQDAPDFIFPNISQGWMQNRFYVGKDSPWRYQGGDSLSKISIGVIAGYSYSDEIDGYLKANRNNPKYVQIVSGDNALEMNLGKLMAGRVGAIIEDTHVIRYYLASHPEFTGVTEAGSIKNSKQSHLYIAFSPKHTQSQKYVEILGNEMRYLRASGELGKILARYMIPDWKN